MAPFLFGDEEAVPRVGRPSKYDPDTMPVLARQKMREGYTREQIGQYFNVTVKTIYEWAAKFSEFREAIKEGAEFTDAQVENALYRNAMNGNIVAQIFWLKNRQPKRWREKPPEETEDVGRQLGDLIDSTRALAESVLQTDVKPEASDGDSGE